MNDEEFENLFKDSEEEINPDEESLSILSSMIEEDGDPTPIPPKMSKKISFSNIPSPEYAYSSSLVTTPNNNQKRIREEAPKRDPFANRQISEFLDQTQEYKKTYNLFPNKIINESPNKKQKLESTTNNMDASTQSSFQPMKPLSQDLSNADFVKNLETYSGISLQSRTVSSEELKTAFDGKKFVKLSQFSHSVLNNKSNLLEEIKSHDWYNFIISF